MKSVNRNSKEIDSPKTPGGISKSLLTPIRRLGLSRKWKNSGASPFVSPLADNMVKHDENGLSDSRKRKRCVNEDNPLISPVTERKELDSNEITCTPPAAKVNADSTPRRLANIRKKSKSFISSTVDLDSTEKQNKCVTLNKQSCNDFSINTQIEDSISNSNTCNVPLITNILPRKIITEEESENKGIQTTTKNEECNALPDNELIESKNKSEVSNLTKECIVVIQKRILKPANKDDNSATNYANKQDDTVSQVLFDSDSDDTPLSHLNKTGLKQNQKDFKSDNETLEDDSINTKSSNVNAIQLPKKTTSTSSKKKLASKTVFDKTTTDKKKKQKERITEIVATDSSSQKSKDFDDGDDDDFDLNRKTIVIRKSYDKVIKPSKSKSTGSITQKDIDELRAKIEMKKKLLIAKSMTKGTEELRGLIKKWQKGCQDALMELLELMRNKVADDTNMNYSYILEMLNIPPGLVGYDEENECFNTPDDNNILAAAFNDI